MRILQIIQKKQYRGAEIFASQLSNHLIELGHIVEMVSIYDGDALLPFQQKISNLSSEKSNRYFDIAGWRKLNQTILDFRPDVVQANAADTLKYAVFSKMIFRWKQPIFYRNASTSSYYIKSTFSKLINSLLLKKVYEIISVSNASKKDLNNLFPFTKLKTIVIPIGIESNSEKPIELGAKRYNIIHVGSFTREKNHSGLLLIFKKIIERCPNTHLHLFGEGPLRKGIENKSIEMDLYQHITFYEGVHNPLPYISGASVLMLPSNIEGLPAVLLEAMYCKTPVIAYNVGGISEIISTDTGSLVKKDDIEDFANEFLKLINNQNDIRLTNAFNLVNSKYMNSKIAKEFTDVYKAYFQ
ncbi:glycosyltransferase [Gillisia sp. Hel_I_29]|uniref:glycosyltransferase n=1 Tax=Gillisia sp. Hel_I_29 TaxID=1249975 RepID=UPI0005561B52|nr:glycosyltransferase [Gillisia sp. Hel_I_29]